MNELTRRMARCGLSRITSRGYNSSGITKQQPRHLLSSSNPSRSISTAAYTTTTTTITATRTLSSANPQRVNFSAESKNNSQVLESTTIEDNEARDIGNVLSSPSSAKVLTDPSSGEQFGMVLDTRKLPKLKPSIVQRRLSNCKTYVGQEKSIRQSPWKLNRICQLAAGLTLEEALTQLKFCSLKNADLVAKVLKRTSNLADIRDGIQMSQLEVAECFATKSMMLRRIKPMGRGRYVLFFFLNCFFFSFFFFFQGLIFF